MQLIKTKLILFIFLLLMPNMARATDYYVDCDTGSDSNDGTSTGTAFLTTAPVEGTNFLNPGDIVNIKRDCVFSGSTNSIFEVKSVGTSANPIIIQAYGSGADPIFRGSVDPAVDVPSWGSWVEIDATNHIWESNVNVPWQVNIVIVDGTHSLSSPFLGFQNSTLLQSIPGKFYHSGSNTKIRVRLEDNSDPNGHTFEFGRYHTSLSGRGLVKVDNSTAQYIEFHNIQTYGSNSFGFTSGNPYISFIDCTARFSARENFYIISNVTNHPDGARHNLLLRVTADDANSWGHNSQGGAGQNITVEASYVDIINSTVKNSHMAGIDFLHYNSDTEPFFGRVIGSQVFNNSRRSKTTFDVGGFDPEIYVDGGSDIQIIDNEIYKTTGYTAGNASDGIKVGTEYADIFTVENIEMLNNRIYGLNGTCFSNISTVGGTASAINPLSNIRIIGNTCVRGSYYLLFSVSKFYVGGLGLYMRNNIFSNPAGSFIGYITSNPDLVDSDYNIFYDLDSESDIFNDTLDLAAWQSASGGDANSQFINPNFTSGHHLSNTAAGQGSTSPAVNAGDETAISGYVISDIGTTRTDDVVDELNNLDIGYHYNFLIDDGIGFEDPTTTIGTTRIRKVNVTGLVFR